MPHRALVLVTVLLAGCVHSYLPPHETGQWDPWEAPTMARLPDESGGAANNLISLYQNWLRRPTVADAGCPMWPSCSVYAQRSYRSYGLWGGTVLTITRLFFVERSAGLPDFPLVAVGARMLLYDPAE